MVSVRSLVRRLQDETGLTIRAVRGTIAVRLRARAERREGVGLVAIATENRRRLVRVAGFSAAVASVVAVATFAVVAKAPTAGVPRVNDQTGDSGADLPRGELHPTPTRSPFGVRAGSVDPMDLGPRGSGWPIAGATAPAPPLVPGPGETSTGASAAGGPVRIDSPQATATAAPLPTPSATETATVQPTPTPSPTVPPTESPSPTEKPTLGPPPWL